MNPNKLQEVVNDPSIYLSPFSDFQFSTIVNSEEELKKFLGKFTDLEPFIDLGLIKWNNESEDYYWNIGKEVQEFTIRINHFFPFDDQLMVVKGKRVFVPDPIEYSIQMILEYPGVITWYGKDSYDRSGDAKIRLLQYQPLSKMTNQIFAA